MLDCSTYGQEISEVPYPFMFSKYPAYTVKSGTSGGGCPYPIMQCGHFSARVREHLSSDPHTSSNHSSNTYKAQKVVVNLALRIVSKSLIPSLQNFNLTPFSLIGDFGKQNTRGNVSKISVSLARY